MKGSQLVIGCLNGRPAAALLRDGALDDLLVAPPGDVPVPDAIYRARAERPMKGLGGIFVTWPGGKGFLRGASGLRPGAPILVQITGYAERGKAVPVTGRILFKSRYCILTPGASGLNVSRAIRDPARRAALEQVIRSVPLAGDMGAILRTAAEAGDDTEIAADIQTTADLSRAVMEQSGDGLLLEGPDPARRAKRDWAEVAHVVEAGDAFATLDLLDRIEALRLPDIPLAAGASMAVEPTRALVAVDVNTGAGTGPAPGLTANVAAARALPAALRLRGLGGQITIDFAPLAKKDRRHVESVLRAAFQSDPVDTTLVGWTPLGHFELQRKRERFPLSEALQ